MIVETHLEFPRSCFVLDHTYIVMKYLMFLLYHTVSFQIFRSPSIHVSFLVKNCTQEFFREIATFSSKTLSFDIFLILTWKMSTTNDFFMTLKSVFT